MAKKSKKSKSSNGNKFNAILTNLQKLANNPKIKDVFEKIGPTLKTIKSVLHEKFQKININFKPISFNL